MIVDIDLVVPECTFDVQQKGPKSRPKGPKLSATVISLEPAISHNKPLFFDPVKTQVNIMSSISNKQAPAPANRTLQVNSAGIGGLDDHIATMNENLSFLTNPAFSFPDRHLMGSTTFLIHGPEGSGKSLLLERLSDCAWHDTFKLDLSSKPKAQAKDISETFEKARDAQPSVVIMDDLDKFLAKAESLVTQLRSELKKLEGSQVVVAAAAQSIYDIDASLRTTSAFKHELEIFPPNVKQREHIVRQIIGPDRAVPGVNFSALAERTHGFVGRDVYKLCGLARNHRVRTVYSFLEAGAEASFGEVLQAQDFVTQADFDAVIDQVQPTVLKDSILEVPKVRWTDIAGLEHVRELLEAIMIRPIKVSIIKTTPYVTVNRE
jgi:AAA family ATPase